jgi:hypothetical protein
MVTKSRDQSQRERRLEQVGIPIVEIPDASIRIAESPKKSLHILALLSASVTSTGHIAT